MTDTVRLPEHLGERGVAVIRPGGRRGAGRREGEGVGWGEERVNHAKERQKGYWQRVTGRSDYRKGFRYKAVHKVAGKPSQQQSLFRDYQAVCQKTSFLSKTTTGQALILD